MAKVTVKYPKAAIRAEIESDIKKILGQDELSNLVGGTVTERIKLNAKSGKPLNNTGTFPSLAESTIENRVRLSKLNNTASVYSPKRSNLSFTGQLLESLSFKRIQSRAFLIEIFFDKDRTPYKTGQKSTAKLGEKNKTNKALAKTLDEIGFTVFSKDGIEKNRALIRRVVNEVQSFIRKKLR